MTDTTHAELYLADERATVILVESVETRTREHYIGHDGRGMRQTVDAPVWVIEWHYPDSRESHSERFPDRKEATVRWVQLLAMSGASP